MAKRSDIKLDSGTAPAAKETVISGVPEGFDARVLADLTKEIGRASCRERV